MKKIKVIILYPNAFPIDGAPTNRVLQIARGLNENGVEVRIICTRGTEKKGNIINKDIEATYQGIHFKYASGSVIWPSSFCGKAKEIFKGLICTLDIILFTKSKPQIILCYANYSLIQNFLFFVISRMRKIKFIYAVDEFPWVLIYKSRYDFLYRKIFLLLFYKLFDALLVMTNNLMVFYAKLKRKNALLHLMPMTVEIERFTKIESDILLNKPYIAYCGWDVNKVNGINVSKDGIDILINAFANVCKKHKHITLYIIGESNEDRHLQVEELGIKEKVVFTGSLHRDEIPIYLCNAVLLCLARPKNLQAQGGFPTKLGEYLATGNPVVATKVGDIQLYLKDGWNSFLAEPNDIDSFAEKMDYALSNPALAKQIGVRGRELAINTFNYKKQGVKLLEFLYSLVG